MTLVNNVLENKYDLINITQDDLLDLSDMINHAPLPLKRGFYVIAKDIDHFLNNNKLPKKK